jgi:hypothetical protein
MLAADKRISEDYPCSLITGVMTTIQNKFNLAICGRDGLVTPLAVADSPARHTFAYQDLVSLAEFPTIVLQESAHRYQLVPPPCSLEDISTALSLFARSVHSVVQKHVNQDYYPFPTVAIPYKSARELAAKVMDCSVQDVAKIIAAVNVTDGTTDWADLDDPLIVLSLVAEARNVRLLLLNANGAQQSGLTTNPIKIVVTKNITDFFLVPCDGSGKHAVLEVPPMLAGLKRALELGSETEPSSTKAFVDHKTLLRPVYQQHFYSRVC